MRNGLRMYIERTNARDRLKESEKRLSQNIYERGVDEKGFGRIRSRGDQALFGGYTTQAMKDKLGVKGKRPLADFLPTLTIAAKNLATEMTNYNVEENDLQGEMPITDEHVQNNSTAYAWRTRNQTRRITTCGRYQETGEACKSAGEETCRERKSSYSSGGLGGGKNG